MSWQLCIHTNHLLVFAPYFEVIQLKKHFELLSHNITLKGLLVQSGAQF